VLTCQNSSMLVKMNNMRMDGDFLKAVNGEGGIDIMRKPYNQ